MESFNFENQNTSTSEHGPNIKKILSRIKKIFVYEKEESEIIKKKDKYKWLEIDEYKEEGFDIEQKLENVNGPLIELAGPTPNGYRLVDVNNLDKKVHVSNQSSKWAKGKLDFEADIKNLPIKNNSVGAVFVSCLGGAQKDDPEELKKLDKKVLKPWATQKDYDRYEELSYTEGRRLRETALEEAYRVLENEGVLIWQGGKPEDVEYGKELGFIIKELKDNKSPGVARTGSSYNVIFEKIKAVDIN